MKLGVLNCCTPQEEKEFDEQEFLNFQNLFSHVDHDLELIEYRVTENEFPDVGACDAYLITGSPKGVYDDEMWIARLADFIHQTHAAQRKLVGICFGHQLLAHTLGGHAEKSEKGWGLGLRSLEIENHQAWMTPQLPQGAFFFCHQDQVMRLPTNAKRLAGNAFCPNGMFAIDDTVLGIQAHPEFTPHVMAKATTWIEQMTNTSHLNAATPNQRSANNTVMAQWIVNFLTQPPSNHPQY